MKDLRALLTTLEIPVARNQFTTSPNTPYIVYLSESPENIGADNRVWHSTPQWRIELYTTKKEGALEERIEALLNEREIYWTKDSDIKIDSESLWLTVYNI